MMFGTSAELVGREDGLRLLGGLLERVGDGAGATVVRGEAGIGKSPLLSEVARLAAVRHMRILTTTGVQSEAQIAFAGLYQLLRPILDQADRLPPPQRSAVLAAFGRSDAAEPELFLIALATLSLLGDAAAQAPVLLVVPAYGCMPPRGRTGRTSSRTPATTPRRSADRVSRTPSGKPTAASSRPL